VTVLLNDLGFHVQHRFTQIDVIGPARRNIEFYGRHIGQVGNGMIVDIFINLQSHLSGRY